MKPRSFWPRIRSLWRNLLHREAVERDLSDELAGYLDLLVAENLAAGMTPDEARRRARLDLGPAVGVQETVRDVQAGQRLAVFGRDLRAAARSLARGKWTVPAVAVLTIAIGIAATTIVFSLVYGVLLRPLAIPEADRLVMVNTRYLPESGYDFPFSAISGPELLDFRSQNRSLSSLAALSYQNVSIGSPGGEAARVLALRTSANLLDVLRVAPAIGRGFAPEEDRPGGACVALVSFGLWTEQFGGDSSVVDHDALIDGRPCRIAAVMPKGFVFPNARVRVWLPLPLDPADPHWARESHGLSAVGRMADGVSNDLHEADLGSLRSRWAVDFPVHHRGHFVITRPLLETLVGSTRPTLLALFGAVLLLLAGVCVNLTGVNLVRTETRRREIAVRMALGGRRSDVLRLALLESLLLAVAGGGIGWLVVWGLGGTIPRLVPGGLPRSEAIAIDGATAAFAAAVTLVVGLVLGVSGALGASRVRVDEAMQGALGRTIAGSRRAQRTRRGLVVTQVALGLALSLTAIGLIESYRRLRQLDLGFDGRQVTVFSLHLAESQYPNQSSVGATFLTLLERVGAIPGVVTAGLISDLPLESAGPGNDFKIEGQSDPGPNRGRNGRYLTVSPGLFPALAIPLRRGRLIEPRDGPGRPLVAVINEALVRRYFADRDPLGQRIRYFDEEELWLTIVGVVGDVRSIPGQPPEPAVYVSHAQETRRPSVTPRSMVVVARTTGEPVGLAAGLRAAVAASAPGTPIAQMRPMTEVIDAASGSARFAMAVMVGFAVTVVLLAALGIYGLLAHTVSARERETGIRMALGADRSTVGIAVVRSGLGLTVAGIAIGLAAAMAAAPAISKFLFEIRVSNPATIGLAAGTLLLVAGAASAIPALRAARLDPRATLAQE